MDRRTFLRNGGLFGALLGAVSSPALANVVNKSSEVSEDVIKALESNSTGITLVNSYDETWSTGAKEVMRIGSNGSMGIGVTPTKQTNVEMKPGPDGNLYIKANHVWKKV